MGKDEGRFQSRSELEERRGNVALSEWLIFLPPKLRISPRLAWAPTLPGDVVTKQRTQSTKYQIYVVQYIRFI